MEGASQKPWVAAACICERVLQEKDGVNSLIRVVDTFHVRFPDQFPEGVRAQIELTLYVALKSGGLVGRHELGLLFHQPDGKTRPPKSWPIVFKEEEEAGANVVVNIQIGDPVPGLYWFDVVWGDDVLTRIPLRVKRAEEPNSQEEATRQ